MIDNESLPVSDDVQSQGPSEQELLDAVMQNSPIMDELEVPLPAEEKTVEDPEESVDVEDPDTEEAVSEEETEESEETTEEVADEDAPEEGATQEAEVLTAEELDLDAKVMVKVDGAEAEVSFGDLLKGYQTDAHLSKKGREIGEAQKALEEERTNKLAEVENLAQATAAMLSGTEQSFAKEYHDLEAKIEKARKEGDTFEVNELKDKREQVQKNYWGAKNQKDQLIAAVQKQKQEVEAKAWSEQIDHFQKEIPNLIPDFNDKVADSIRTFALEEGIAPEVLNQITDPKIVKFVDDYRRLKQGLNKGAAKRKVIPAKKALPTKKAPPATKKAADKEKMVKARAFKENASQDDQMDFLRQYASKSLNL